ncbi:MAG: hypothetical protein K5751_03520, partial [Treponemataceae bacterium]|nr:hypothetical protein [Treponemataceae bacterium]
MKRVSVSVVKKICFILLGLLFISLFVSCEYFNYNTDFDVTESVIERLDKATFGDFSELYKDDSIGLLNNGERCISYSTMDLISGRISNPRNYSLDINYTPSDGSRVKCVLINSMERLESESPSNYDIAFLLDELGRFRARFSSYYLHSKEVLPDKRTISGTITLNDKNNGREFDKREISFRVNTPPPGINDDKIMLQRNDDGTKYILCFMLPKPASVDVVHEIDTHAFSMNGSLVYFDIDSRSFYTDAEMETPAESYSSERP